VSRKSILAKCASSALASQIPLRGYFVSVGLALLLLLLVVNRMSPAPSPGQATELQSALPRIRIHTEAKGPEAVVIDTNRPMPLPVDTATASAPPLLSSKVIEAAQPLGSFEPSDGEESDRSTPPIPSRLRDSMAKADATLPDQATTDRRGGEVASAVQRRRTPPRSAKRRRSARPLALDTPLSRCNSSSLERSSCRPAFTFPQMN
jgi:hypothetical protein